MELFEYLHAAEFVFGQDPGEISACGQTLSKLAERGNPDAMVQLGVLVEEFPDILSEFAPALSWFFKARELGHPRGYYNVARTQFDQQDYVSAFEGFENATYLGDRTSLAYLGQFYEKGLGVPRNQMHAFRFYRLAAMRGELIGALRLGQVARSQKLNPCDLDWVFHCLDRYVDKSSDAAYEIAYLLLTGISPSNGPPRDPIAYMTKAAKQGNVDAQLWMGEAFFYGDGCEKNLTEAAEFLEKAANEGDTRAMNLLAILHSKNEDVLQDLGKARELLERASSLGDIDAPDLLKSLIRRKVKGT